MATYIAAYQTGDTEHRLRIDADRITHSDGDVLFIKAGETVARVPYPLYVAEESALGGGE